VLARLEYFRGVFSAFYPKMMSGSSFLFCFPILQLQFKFMKSLLIVLLFVSFGSTAQQENFNEDSIAVRSVIDHLFLGMYQGDSALVGRQFSEDVRMLTTFLDNSGAMRSEIGAVEDFKIAVGTPHIEVWDERISNVDIQIDGLLAQVWMHYSFYVDDVFSHCGVNAMQLIKSEEGWKIVNLIDTRRRSDCY